MVSLTRTGMFVPGSIVVSRSHSRRSCAKGVKHRAATNQVVALRILVMFDHSSPCATDRCKRNANFNGIIVRSSARELAVEATVRRQHSSQDQVVYCNRQTTVA